MSAYAFVRFVYRQLDRVLLKHLPAQSRMRALIFRVARRFFPIRIKARSVGEFAQPDSSRRLPAWAEAEVTALVAYEPALAMRWIIQFSRARSEKTMAERLAAELILASKGEGSTIKKKEDTHRMAEANRAFAHYRW